MSKSWCRVAMLSLALAAMAGCDSMKGKSADENEVKSNTPVAPSGVVTHGSDKTMADSSHKMAVATVHSSRAATTQPSNNDITGKVTFTEIRDGKILIVADINGLSPGKHGFHIHQNPDLSAANLTSAGDHFDPAGTGKHGNPMDMSGMTGMIHAGDMGNLDANDQGHAHLELTVADLTIDGDKNGVIGHSVIIHAKPDDYVTQPSGNSGGRVAGGVIESVMP